MKKKFDFLWNLIKEKSKDKKIYYLANPWNYWDWLIREWTIKFFKDYWIEFEEIKLLNNYNGIIKKLIPYYFRLKIFLLKNNNIFIYWWWWAWCNNWNHALFFVKLASKKCKVIVLPSTYENNYEYIKNVIFFKRDKFNSKKNMPNSIFCHDMAFYLSNIESKEKKQKMNWYFFRTDKESANKIRIPKKNLDISLMWDEHDDIHIFINEIDKYKTIYTDRLHVWIAWALLWKEVNLYSWNYFKIFDIYKSSIKPYFKNVYFKKHD